MTHDLLQTTFPVALAAIEAAVIEHGGWEGELAHVRRDGTAIVVASRWSVQRNQRGDPIAILEINRDISDRKRAEEALRTAEAELAHVTRVTTLGEVTASFAHEVNQPLAAIVNNANACLALLPNGIADLDEVREALADIRNDAERASAVIERVRGFARRTPPERKPVALAEVVEDVVALVSPESRARAVRIDVDVEAGLPAICGDRIQIQQVLLNLVMNGMDAMSAVTERERVLSIQGHPEKGDGVEWARISVRDRGVGLAPGTPDELFEAFYTTKPSGTGLGLAISRSIVEAHGGRLWAEAEPGPGATFVFRIPGAAATPS